MLRTRLRDGLPLDLLGVEAHTTVKQLQADGLIDIADEHVVLTVRGRLLADAVVRALLA